MSRSNRHSKICLQADLEKSIFSMNVFEITQDRSGHSIWMFFVVAAVLVLFTAGAWTMYFAIQADNRHRRGLKNMMTSGTGAA